jgi:peptidoglycan/LPS O-acetylase OafA/YrhL
METAADQAWDRVQLVAVVIPLIALNASITTPAWFARFGKWLGDLSYPLYLVHYPVLSMVWLGTGAAMVQPTRMAPLYVLAAITTAVAVHHFIEVPLAWYHRRRRRQAIGDITASVAIEPPPNDGATVPRFEVAPDGSPLLA